MAAEPEPRRPLTRDRILRAALELADESGIEGLTMRRLGQILGFEAMSLYNHVANKDAVIDGILDLVLAETEMTPPDEPWDTGIRRSAISVNKALRRHTWAAALLMAPGRIRPERLRHMDALLGRLRDEGFSAETTYHVYHVLDGYIFGFSLWQTSHSYSAEEIESLTEKFAAAITADAYPHLHEHAEQHFAEGPHQEVSAFEYGLDLILDGLRKIRDAG
jgi:AcrR family transcriptional regulator